MFINLLKNSHFIFLKFILKWGVICLLVSILSGSSSAIFLHSLNFIENIRMLNSWLIYFLPIAGLTIGLAYFYGGKELDKGNNLIINQYHHPSKIIDWKLTPLIYLSTLLTHLVGGSAGREGTAVQMASGLSDQICKWFELENLDRKIILMMAIAGGFSSVFGTPLAGAFFALEILVFNRKLKLSYLFPITIVAFLANYIALLWGVEHNVYKIAETLKFGFSQFFWSVVVGFCFGFAAYLFKFLANYFTLLFNKWVVIYWLKPIVGGLILILLFTFPQFQIFKGLGISTIVESFHVQQLFYVFLGKIIFTTFTLSSGFKGGEVTPLFFIGATLGSCLSFFIPLPISLLAAMGFIGVFSGATHTPIACFFMGLEIFGTSNIFYFLTVVIVAHLFSGKRSIYSAQNTRYWF